MLFMVRFRSTGKFVLRQSMDNVGSSENFQYVIRATDYGEPPRTATSTVNVVYDPYLNTTTTEATNTTTPMEPVVTGDAGSLWAEPLVIGQCVYAHKDTSARIHARTHARTVALSHARTHTHTHTHTYTHTHARTHAHTRARTHTHTHLSLIHI